MRIEMFDQFLAQSRSQSLRSSLSVLTRRNEGSGDEIVLDTDNPFIYLDSVIVNH
jgi:hypothetical protein